MKIEVGEKVMRVSIGPNPTKAEVQNFNKLMDCIHDSYNEEIAGIARTLEVSDAVASDIWYLRTRSRWTPEMEKKIVEAYRAGTPIDSGAILSGDWRG